MLLFLRLVLYLAELLKLRYEHDNFHSVTRKCSPQLMTPDGTRPVQLLDVKEGEAKAIEVNVVETGVYKMCLGAASQGL